MEATQNTVFQNNLYHWDAAALAHLEKAYTGHSHYLGWETSAQETQTFRMELHCPGAQKETGKNLILNTFLLRHLSTYFSVLSHLKETGYRLCGRVWTSNSTICLSQVKIEVGWFSSSICTFLTLQNRNRNKKAPTSFQEGQRANLCLPDIARPQQDKSLVSKIHKSWEYLQQWTKASSSWEECGWKQS